MNPDDPLDSEASLDPEDWEAMRRLGHRMVDDMMEYLRTVRDRPAWTPLPSDFPSRFGDPAPASGEDPERVYERFLNDVAPYPLGNTHPRFWGWVIGTGSPIGMLAAMLAAGLNPNAWGGGQAAIHVELQVLRWLKEALGFPSQASGLLVSGGSMANLIAMVVARDQRAGFDVRRQGLTEAPTRLAVYASAEVHSSIQKAVELAGLGTDSLRRIRVSDDFTIDLAALREAVETDRDAGVRPLCLVGCAGTVNTGAIDDLEGLARIAQDTGMWFHIDGAFGALAALVPDVRPRLRGMHLADSIAFDLHKWMYMPYDVGCVLVRDPDAHRGSFALTASYLAQTSRGVAGPGFSASDYGPELSRSFRALKVWMSLRTHGMEAYSRLIGQNIRQAAYLARRIDSEPRLERLAPAPLNIVCFRFRPEGTPEHELNRLNQEVLLRLQESGAAVPSHTTLGGRFCIRVAISNHRSRREDFDLLIDETLRQGETVLAEQGAAS